MLKPSQLNEGCCPVQWRDRHAIVTLPDQMDVSNVGAIRERLLAVLNRGAQLLTADMTATVSCDYAGAEALVRVHQRAMASATDMRLVVGSPVVRRVLTISGLDRLVPVYPTLEAAMAAHPTAAVVPLTSRRARVPPDRSARAARPAARWTPGAAPDAPVNLGVLQKVANALRDGIALADEAGVIVMVNRRAEEMFGYEHAGLAGLPLDTLIPARLQDALGAELAPALHAPGSRTAGGGLLLAGRRKDGTTISAYVSLTPIPTATGRLTLAVICDAEGLPLRRNFATTRTEGR